jgi:RNA polymerase sigma-70 factor (ECF subfamily)
MLVDGLGEDLTRECVFSGRSGMVAEDLERRLREAGRIGDFSGAVSLGLAHYAPELLGFLMALTRDLDAAEEILAEVFESAWRGFPRFEWRSSFRTWLYVLARNAHADYVKAPDRRRWRPLSRVPELSQLVAQVRTRTAPYLRTETKSRVAKLRERLAADEQILLICRIDRQMSWDDVAKVLAPEHTNDAAALRRASVSCRKRFERIVAKLRALAEAEGLLSDEAASQ